MRRIVILTSILLAVLAAISPAFSAVVGNPQVALSTNKSSYVPGDLFVLSAALQSGTQNNVVDGYVQVQIPGGQVFYLLPDLVNFSLAPTPVGRSLPVPDLASPIPVTVQVVPSFLPSGTYTFSAFGVAPGSNPLDAANRRSNVAGVSVSLTTSASGLTGTWNITVVVTQQGCFFPADNGTFSGTGVIAVVQSGNTFSGHGTFTFSTRSENVTFNGVIAGNSLTGTFMFSGPGFAGSGSLAGTVNGDMVTLSLSGNFTSGEQCVVNGSASGTIIR